MTSSHGDGNGQGAGNGHGDYEVGYRKPPARHRFPKGQSGNPAGRPKKQSKPSIPEGKGLDFATQAANQLLMQEAYRPVVLREGDKLIELPAIQAVFRAMGVSAMKGNRHAQRMIAELVQQVETADRTTRSEYFQTLVEYKTNAERELAQARAKGLPDPEILPHPDDIFIDPRTGEAQVNGPMTEHEKAEWDRVIQHRDGMQAMVSDYATQYRSARRSERKDILRSVWHDAQLRFDEVNDNLPQRYQAVLKDRSREDGASRPGSQKNQHWQD